MLPSNGLRTLWHKTFVPVQFSLRRYNHNHGFNRLSKIWSPNRLQRATSPESHNDGHELLVRAGFLRQAQSGIFHLLPLGLRVLNKLEALIDKHMTAIGASKLSLSSLSSQDLWQRSGRLDGRNAEFFKLEDRKKTKLLLAPTHEEEITTIVANTVESYKDLPVRLYQISRKYRDEARPRQGLLRGREFVMKDLYTFDLDDVEARRTYEEVRGAYRAILSDLGLPFLVATADSGNMGGSLSHEYHFVSQRGEDTIITCDKCDFAINEELFTGQDIAVETINHASTAPHKIWTGITKDRETILKVAVPADGEMNISVVKSIMPNIDTTIESPTTTQLQNASKLVALVDPRLAASELQFDPGSIVYKTLQAPKTLTKARNGDECPSCKSGQVVLRQAVEIGHTFHLGTRYSHPLKAQVLDTNSQRVDLSMGCHGIGVSRLIGAIATLLADSKGLNWPVGVAPYDVLLTAGDGVSQDHVEMTYNQVGSSLDVIVDDRARSMGWRLNDADLVGYPFILVLGKAWTKSGRVELQCRQLAIREEVEPKMLRERLDELCGLLRQKMYSV